MALTLNKKTLPAILAHAHAAAWITPQSSPTVAVYRISRYWRELFLTATRHRSEHLPQWSEKEVAAANVIINAVLFLAMENCKDVEQLINDTLTKHIENNGNSNPTNR